MNNKISNQNFSAPTYSNSSIDGLVKISQTIGGHIDELDDTLGAERRVRCHPNGTREIWTNDSCDIVVYGDNYKMVIGNDSVTVTGAVNIVVNGDCNTTVGGNYNLTVLKDMNVSVKGNIVQKCDGAYVTETTNGDIIHNSGSQLQNHSVGDMVTRCGGAYDCRVAQDFTVNAQTTSFLGNNFVCGAAGIISMASGISTTISGTLLNLAGSNSINLQSVGFINNTSPITTIDSPVITTTGVVSGENFVAGLISLITHKHISATPGSPTSTPIP
jgi:hypothetical protein